MRWGSSSSSSIRLYPKISTTPVTHPQVCALIRLVKWASREGTRQLSLEHRTIPFATQLLYSNRNLLITSYQSRSHSAMLPLSSRNRNNEKNMSKCDDDQILVERLRCRVEQHASSDRLNDRGARKIATTRTDTHDQASALKTIVTNNNLSWGLSVAGRFLHWNYEFDMMYMWYNHTYYFLCDT